MHLNWLDKHFLESLGYRLHAICIKGKEGDGSMKKSPAREDNLFPFHGSHSLEGRHEYTNSCHMLWLINAVIVIWPECHQWLLPGGEKREFKGEVCPEKSVYSGSLKSESKAS